MFSKIHANISDISEDKFCRYVTLSFHRRYEILLKINIKLDQITVQVSTLKFIYFFVRCKSKLFSKPRFHFRESLN